MYFSIVEAAGIEPEGGGIGKPELYQPFRPQPLVVATFSVFPGGDALALFWTAIPCARVT